MLTWCFSSSLQFAVAIRSEIRLKRGWRESSIAIPVPENVFVSSMPLKNTWYVRLILLSLFTLIVVVPSSLT